MIKQILAFFVEICYYYKQRCPCCKEPWQYIEKSNALPAGGAFCVQWGNRGKKRGFAERKTPSGAAVFVLGGSNNGWIEWRDKDGKTLDELFRKGQQ